MCLSVLANSSSIHRGIIPGAHLGLEQQKNHINFVDPGLYPKPIDPALSKMSLRQTQVGRKG